MAIKRFHRVHVFCRSAGIHQSGFTLVELLAVMAIAAMLIIPFSTGIKQAGSVTAAAWDIASVLEYASGYAKANNTYVWVGFFEEAMDVPGVKGVGRIVISTVASSDGTQIIEPSGAGRTIDSTRLIQLGKLLKIDHMHLADVPLPVSSGAAGASDSWTARPNVQTKYVTYGIRETGPSPTIFPFTYPVGNNSAPSRYTFMKTIEFTPSGEALLNTSYSLVPWIEVGLQPTHGSIRDLSGGNYAAVQIAGVSEGATVYRP